MNREWVMASVMVVATLTVSLLVLRWLAPQLLGIPIDLQMVSVSESKPAYFEAVFNAEDLAAPEYIVPDPISGVRGRPLYMDEETVGPNDILGFRNLAVPNLVDIAIVGDSQTYGNNAPIHLNWPHQLSDQLNEKRPVSVYSMAVGGWGAVQYLYAASNVLLLEPRVLVIAFYTGNDSLESFKLAYNYDAWKFLRPNPALSASDVPNVRFPLKEEEKWPVTFNDGVSTVFTPGLRYAANMPHPAVQAGYQIMAAVARDIAVNTMAQGVRPVFTIIPTKELVYREKLRGENRELDDDYATLVEAEAANIDGLSRAIRSVEGAVYVDVVSPLQEAALDGIQLYPSDDNGHPWPAGYGLIGRTIAEAVNDLVPERPTGLVLLEAPRGEAKHLFIDSDGYWHFSEPAMVAANGWAPGDARPIKQRDLAGLRFAGTITGAVPEKFGPR